jgi:hypothetical protein
MYKLMTKAALRCVLEMAEAEKREDWGDAEIVRDGFDCWLGSRRVHHRTVTTLLHLCLLHDSSNQNGVERYTLNEDGRAMAKNPDHEPRIVETLRTSARLYVKETWTPITP